MKLNQVFFALLLAICAGLMTPEGSLLIKGYHLMGQLFLNALMCVVIPLVVTSVISSVSQMSADLGKKIFTYFALTSFLAVLVGFGFAQLFPSTILQVADNQVLNDPVGMEEIVLNMVPSNIFLAAVKGQILGLILFSLLFGFCMSKIDSELSSVLFKAIKGMNQIMLLMTRFIMKALPIGAFGLMAEVVATTGLDAIKLALWFLLLVVSALGVYACVVLPLLLMARGVHPLEHFRKLAPALFTAFSTSSSAAALPTMIECMRHNSKSHLTLPLGSSLNLPGTALFICMAVFFLAGIYGVPLTIGMKCAVIALSFFASFGIAGVPSASIVALLLVLHAMGLPTEGIGVIFAVERILDMFRSAVNVAGNTTSTALIAGEEDALEASI